MYLPILEISANNKNNILEWECPYGSRVKTNTVLHDSITHYGSKRRAMQEKCKKLCVGGWGLKGHHHIKPHFSSEGGLTLSGDTLPAPPPPLHCNKPPWQEKSVESYFYLARIKTALSCACPFSRYLIHSMYISAVKLFMSRSKTNHLPVALINCCWSYNIRSLFKVCNRKWGAWIHIQIAKVKWFAWNWTHIQFFPFLHVRTVPLPLIN